MDDLSEFVPIETLTYDKDALRIDFMIRKMCWDNNAVKIATGPTNSAYSLLDTVYYIDDHEKSLEVWDRLLWEQGRLEGLYPTLEQNP